MIFLLDSVAGITTKKSTNRRKKGDLNGRGGENNITFQRLPKQRTNAKAAKKTIETIEGGANKLSRFLTAIKLTYVIMFLPILIIFFYSVFRDPATPQILRACWGILKKKAVGYLGRPEDIDLENKRS